MPVRTLTEVKSKYKVVAEERGQFIRFGEIPKDEKSKNFLTGKKLQGVSCYWVEKKGHLYYVVGDTVHPTFGIICEHFVNEHRKAYLISGVEVGIGPDREPLVRNIKVEKELVLGEVTDYDGKISRSLYWLVEKRIKAWKDERQKTAMLAYLRAHAKEYDPTLSWIEREEFNNMDYLAEDAVRWYYGEDEEEKKEDAA